MIEPSRGVAVNSSYGYGDNQSIKVIKQIGEGVKQKSE